MERRKVVRVTKTEFELDNGVVYPHIDELEEVPTLEEFQAIYDHWIKVLMEETDALRRIAEYNSSSEDTGRKRKNSTKMG
jgi:sporulation-control protein spo0M